MQYALVRTLTSIPFISQSNFRKMSLFGKPVYATFVMCAKYFYDYDTNFKTFII